MRNTRPPPPDPLLGADCYSTMRFAGLSSIVAARFS